MGHLIHRHSVYQKEVVGTVASAHIQAAHKLRSGSHSRQLLEYADKVRGTEGCIAPRKDLRRDSGKAGLRDSGALLLVRLNYSSVEGIDVRHRKFLKSRLHGFPHHFLFDLPLLCRPGNSAERQKGKAEEQ